MFIKAYRSKFCFCLKFCFVVHKRRNINERNDNSNYNSTQMGFNAYEKIPKNNVTQSKQETKTTCDGRPSIEIRKSSFIEIKQKNADDSIIWV